MQGWEMAARPQAGDERYSIGKDMRPLGVLVEMFVNTFGITRPSARDEVRAGRFLAAMLVAVAIVVGVAAWLLHGAFARVR